jgi:hypothetical protein
VEVAERTRKPVHWFESYSAHHLFPWACGEIGSVRAGALMRVERSESKTGS